MKNLTPELREELKNRVRIGSATVHPDTPHCAVSSSELRTLLAASEELDRLRSENAAMREALEKIANGRADGPTRPAIDAAIDRGDKGEFVRLMHLWSQATASAALSAITPPAAKEKNDASS